MNYLIPLLTLSIAILILIFAMLHYKDKYHEEQAAHSKTKKDYSNTLYRYNNHILVSPKEAIIHLNETFKEYKDDITSQDLIELQYVHDKWKQHLKDSQQKLQQKQLHNKLDSLSNKVSLLDTKVTVFSNDPYAVYVPAHSDSLPPEAQQVIDAYQRFAKDNQLPVRHRPY